MKMGYPPIGLPVLQYKYLLINLDKVWMCMCVYFILFVLFQVITYKPLSYVFIIQPAEGSQITI